MSQIAIVFGAVLTLIGVGFYLGTGEASPTALIPAFIGLPIAACGLVARRESLRRHAMHVAVLLAVLGFAGCVPGLLKLPALVAGAGVARPLAVLEQAVTAFVCLAFVVLGVRSFVSARRARHAGGAA